MYQRETNHWMKHFDFIILDIIILEVSFFLSTMVVNGVDVSGWGSVYFNTAIFIIPLSFFIAISTRSYSDIISRGDLLEITNILKYMAIVVAGILLFWYFGKYFNTYSRRSFILFILWSSIFLFIGRSFRKIVLSQTKQDSSKRRQLLCVTTADRAETLAETVLENTRHTIKVVGMVLTDENAVGCEIGGIPVVACADDAASFIQKNWIDEVLFDVAEQDERAEHLLEQCRMMGVTIHINLMKERDFGENAFIEKVAGYQVITSSMVSVTPVQMFLKRMIDICAGLVGCLATGILFIFFAPIIYISSPGPIFFGQVRVGRNGRKFKIYKFRSMYMDAEEKKKDLMDENKMDGLMFKMDEDPRIIGSGPDGKKHGFGWFIRTFSLDEYPQFYNILKGDMSLVGTRPPTVDEWENYELHHRARLALRPGLTGLWQVSGRSKITDFEEVVKLDTEYIRNWSLSLDIKIIFRTILVVLRREGSQ